MTREYSRDDYDEMNIAAMHCLAYALWAKDDDMPHEDLLEMVQSEWEATRFAKDYIVIDATFNSNTEQWSVHLAPTSCYKISIDPVRLQESIDELNSDL